MSKKVLLDTCFIRALVDETQPSHSDAKDFFKHFSQEKMRLLLSTIVLSEYALASDPQKLLATYQFEIVTFAPSHAIKSHDVNFKYYKDKSSVPRVCLKDDFKIIAQCAVEKHVDYFVSSDADLCKILSDRTNLQDFGFKPGFKVLKFSDGIGTYFNIGNQGSLF